jgi:uncharacterized SAM-binding protein YcdF (DUF218 family)
MTTIKNLHKRNLSLRKKYALSLLVRVALFTYLLIVLTHRFWLPFAADFLVLQNQPRHAELIVVATPFRPRFLYALNLFKKGYANQILLVGDTRIKTHWSGKTSLALAKAEAIKQGIPEAIIHTQHSTGTRADALQAKSLMSALGLKSALIISDPYNMRRLAMIFDHIFDESSMEITLISTDQKRDIPDNWWISPHAFVYVIKEWVKFPINYYLLNFQAPKEIQQPQERAEKPPEKFLQPKLDSDDIFSNQLPQNLFRLIRFKIGEFLVVDENGATPDAVITPLLTPHALACYQAGHCKKVFLFSGASGYIRNTMKEGEIRAEIDSRAQKLGIKAEDFKVTPYAVGDAYQTTHLLNQFMDENKLKIVNLYLPYYETRKFQFYFKKFLRPEFTVQVKPLESSYQYLLERWLQNTGLGNIFLDQYLLMAHYYFNKFLWSPPTSYGNSKSG